MQLQLDCNNECSSIAPNYNKLPEKNMIDLESFTAMQLYSVCAYKTLGAC